MRNKIVTVAFSVFIILLSATICIADYTEQPSVSTKAYSIKPVPFNDYEIISDVSGIPIVFSEYGKTVKVSYPAPEDAVIQDPSLIMENCREVIRKTADEIALREAQNTSVKGYLTFENRLPLLGKEGILDILADPREMTFQKNTASGKTVAEFRSKEFDIDDNTKFCVYITFLCDPKTASVEKIIISAVKLEG